MTNVYKIELCVIDHDELGADGIEEVLEETKYPNYCISPKVLTVEGKDIGEWYDEHQLNYTTTQQQELAQLFSPWLPITTAPRDGTRFLLWYALERRPYVVYWETDSDPDDSYIVVDSPSDHRYRNCIDPKNLISSYWQPLQTPPQL